jgi:hypothetical protein
MSEKDGDSKQPVDISLALKSDDLKTPEVRELLTRTTYQDPLDIAAQAIAEAITDLIEQLVDARNPERCHQIRKVAAEACAGFDRLEACAITRDEQLQDR